MFSNIIKLLFVVTAYSPVFLIVGLVEISNIRKEGYNIIWVNSWLDLFNRINFIWCFFILAFICFVLIKFAERNLTINNIEVKSIKSADFNIATLFLSYFLPCIELLKKDTIYLIVWVAILICIIILNKNTYFYNPLLKIYGYRYYEIATKKEVTFIMISKEKLINSNQIKSYSQLTDYVIINN